MSRNEGLDQLRMLANGDAELGRKIDDWIERYVAVSTCGHSITAHAKKHASPEQLVGMREHYAKATRLKLGEALVKEVAAITPGTGDWGEELTYYTVWCIRSHIE